MTFDHQFNMCFERAFFIKIDNSSFSLLKSGSRITLCESMQRLEHFPLLSLNQIVALPFYVINYDLTTVTEYPCLSSQTYFTTHGWDNRNIWNLRVLSPFIYTLFWHGAMSLFLCGHRSSPAFPKKFRLIDVTIVNLTFFGFPRCSYFPVLPSSRTP